MPARICEQNDSFLGEHGKGDYDKNDVKVMIMLEHWVKISPYTSYVLIIWLHKFGSELNSYLCG